MIMKRKYLLYSLLALWLFVGCFYIPVDAAAKPSAPVVTASNDLATGKIKLTWKKVSGASKYKIFRSTTQNGTYTLMNTVTGTTYTNKTAVAGKMYYYKVKAVASDGTTSAYSAVKSRTCDLPRTKVTLSNVAASGKIKVSWDAVDGAIGYKVLRSSTENGEYKLLKETTNTNYTDTSATAGKKYFYKVRALAQKEAANSALSVATYRKCDLKRPEVSIKLNATGKPRLDWTAVDGAVGYDIYRSKSKNGTYTLIKTVKVTYFGNTGAEYGNEYFYKVVAKHSDTAANSAYSTIVSIVAKEPVTVKYVTEPSTTLYSKPDNSSSTIKVPYMAKVEIGAPNASGSLWYRVYYDGKLYYAYIGKDSTKFTETCSSFEYTGNTEYQQQVLDLAVEIATEWKTSYEFGQSNGVLNEKGTYGFDCSGFASYVLEKVIQPENPAYNMPPTVKGFNELDAIYNQGYNGEFNAKTVKLSDIQPGDVIIFSLVDPHDHCGIYLGNDEFAHSVIGFDGVMISPIKGIYKEKILTIKRVLPEIITPSNQERYLTTNCGMFSAMSTSSQIGKFVKGEKVTVLFKDSHSVGNWTYVRRESGEEVFLSGNWLSETPTT